ncbi:MAG: hypothetical protein RQ763_07060 [Sulfurimonas sp.]|uniref:hypothetical protein n=1 Tax=Sulfurimonas sp. TaxID=2022749 RepID=UPI0028CEC5DB|nr:hypothetical protein [Sulfurimonas sp.]MDT8338941.1 hypothetical protein [Sulfurimonas sp.]
MSVTNAIICFMNLKELENRAILLFGKSRAFSMDEFESQLKFHKIEITSEFNEDVALVVDAKMMTPYEQNISEALYNKHSQSVEFVSIDALERELAKYIDANTLLMSLKLSRNKERLKSFLQNSMIDDALFFKLLKMYSWGGEDFFENDDNRDVSAAIILRFYQNIERNHNVQYATTGFMHLVSQTKNMELLYAILSLEPIRLNPNIQVAIARNVHCDDEMQELLFKTNDLNVLEALSQNRNLKPALIEEFLKDEKLGRNVAKNIKLTDELFELFKTNRIGLALNESLTLEMQKELLSYGDEEISYALALNNGIDGEILHLLLESKNEEIKSALYENKKTPTSILEEAYRNNQYCQEIAKNENTPVEILYQLQLDSRYARSVMENPAFGRYIQQENIGWEV